MKVIYTIISFLFILMLFSCVSQADTKYQAAGKLREKANKYNLKKYAEKEFEDAENDYAQAKEYMDKKNDFKADKLLDQVNKKYQLVLDKGFPPCAEDKNKITAESQKTAVDIKANVAVKDMYDDAEKTLSDAVKLKESKSYENAIDTFDKADEKYKNAYTKAKEKKDKAEKSMSVTSDAFLDMEKRNAELKKQIDDLKSQKSN
jgi:hypothetical protein